MLTRQQLLIMILILLHLLVILLIMRRTRRWWVHPLNETRTNTSVMNRIMQLREYPDRFFEYFRMYPATFDYLLRVLTPAIKKQDTIMRKAIDPHTRLCVTLHYLATGASYGTIAFHYALGKSTVSGIIEDTCQAIWNVLSPIYLAPPTTHEEWRSMADAFYEQWDLPNTVGALDGKHITIRAPDNSGTNFFNYKKTFSIVLMAVVDASYKFKMVDIGQRGSVSDGGVWDNSEMGRGWNDGRVNTPPPQNLPDTDTQTPFFLVGDEAFPLKPNLMRPYPGAQTRQNFDKRRFNYRLSRARRVVENAFGILSSRWRVLFTPIDAPFEKATGIVKATCKLHNFLCEIRDNHYVPPGFADHVQRDGAIVDGFWRAGADRLGGFDIQPPRHHQQRAATIRDNVKDWCGREGARHWQDDLINRVR